jgi:hypothetical protein
MAEYSGSRSLLPDPTTSTVMRRTVTLPVAPLALSPFKTTLMSNMM